MPRCRRQSAHVQVRLTHGEADRLRDLLQLCWQAANAETQAKRDNARVLLGHLDRRTQRLIAALAGGLTRRTVR